MGKNKKVEYELSDTAKFTISEAYKMARTNLMFSISTSKKHTVVFTSCSAHEGKSTTCINIATSMAKAGKKTLLLDCDLRKPTIHRRLKVKNPNGLANVIGGFCTLEEALNKDVIENLDVIAAGTIPPNPTELLASERMAEILVNMQDKYDMVLIDMPPVDIVIDSQLLNKYISGIVFIVKEGFTTHPLIKECLRKIEMAEGKVLGFVKTSCVPKSGRGAKKYSNSSYHTYTSVANTDETIK